MCLLIHACLSCLLLLRVESGLIHPGWIKGVWTCPTVCELSVWRRFGKGSSERPCRSTWWVVSLQPSSGTEFYVCDPWFNYYHALGPKPMDPLGFLITLVLCPGVVVTSLVLAWPMLASICASWLNFWNLNRGIGSLKTLNKRREKTLKISFIVPKCSS